MGPRFACQRCRQPLATITDSGFALLVGSQRIGGRSCTLVCARCGAVSTWFRRRKRKRRRAGLDK